MKDQPSRTPLDRAKAVHHRRWTDYTLRQFDDEAWRTATNDANNGRDAARVTTTTRPAPHLKIQQPLKPLPPPEPPPPQSRRPRPVTATGNHVRQRAANHHQSGLTLPRLKSQPRQGTGDGAAPGDASDGQRIELE